MAGENGTRAEQVMAAVRARLQSRALAVGERLPSIRGFAATMGVSPATVVEAYDRLAAEGLISARRGSGFYVVGGDRTALALTLTQAGADPDRSVDPFWVSRQSLDADPAALKPGCGWLPSGWMPDAALRRAMRTLARTGQDVLTDYGGARGSTALRRILLGRLAAEGVEVAPDQIVLTASGTQAIDLVCRLLIHRGDTVLVDDPCYFNFRALLQAHGARIVGVPYTPTGPDPEAFEATLAVERPKLYLTNVALHNPTGATLSPRTAHRLLSAAAAHGLMIVEDDIFADFEPEPSPRLAALGGLERVIRIGSFSKTLSASLRCGYVAARPDVVDALIDLQIATGFGGPSPVAAALLADILASGSYRKHVETLRRRLARARDETASRLAPLGVRPWLMPRGGFFLWCGLPDGQDGAVLARAALASNVILAPGDVFSVSQTASAFLRFNVAQSGDQRVFDVLRQAMAAASKS